MNKFKSIALVTSLFFTLAALGMLSGIQYVVVWTQKAFYQKLETTFVLHDERDDSN